MISILIVDDELLKISSIISCIHSGFQRPFEIRQASSVQEAIEMLKKQPFHLLITDLLMPIRVGEPPDKDGGKVLVREIYKKSNKVHVPIFIIGMTQIEALQNNFEGIWNVFSFDAAKEDWKIKLKKLINHIDRVESKIVSEKKKTIFVEGPTDKSYLEMAFEFFYPRKLVEVEIDTIDYGGGASWVERQLIIWGKTLLRGNDGDYLPSIGLFDQDKAGKHAIERLKTSIDFNSAEYNTFSIITLDRKYARHIIPVFASGISLPITIEEMLSPECWKTADEKGWLSPRNLSEDLLQDPQKWDKTNFSLKEFVQSLKIDTELLPYVYKKMNPVYKTNLVENIRNLPTQEKDRALIGFKLLIEEFLSKFKIDIDN